MGGGIKAQCWDAVAGGALHMERIWRGVPKLKRSYVDGKQKLTLFLENKNKIKNREENEICEFIAQCMKERGGSI